MSRSRGHPRMRRRRPRPRRQSRLLRPRRRRRRPQPRRLHLPPRRLLPQPRPRLPQVKRLPPQRPRLPSQLHPRPLRVHRHQRRAAMRGARALRSRQRTVARRGRIRGLVAAHHSKTNAARAFSKTWCRKRSAAIPGWRGRASGASAVATGAVASTEPSAALPVISAQRLARFAPEAASSRETSGAARGVSVESSQQDCGHRPFAAGFRPRCDHCALRASPPCCQTRCWG